MEECIFCKMSKGKVKIKKIYENDNFFSMPDANQKVRGHSLVISKNHYETILDLPPSLGMELLDCIKNTALKVMEIEGAGGFNLVQNNFAVAGQVVKHLHFHILPRKKGDKSPLVY